MAKFGSTIYLALVLWSAIIITTALRILVVILGVKYIIRWLHHGESNSVLYLAAFAPENAGYNYRVLKWAEHLKNDGAKVNIKHAAETESFGKQLHHTPALFQANYLMRRWFQVIGTLGYKTVVVRRELLLYNDHGHLFLERFLLSLHPNVILDFDDDISAAKGEPLSPTLFGYILLLSRSKFKSSLSLYRRFIVGSSHLKRKILDENPQAVISVIPTCVDYSQYPTKEYQDGGIITFGWIGNTNNQKYLDPLISALNQLHHVQPLKLLVISGASYDPKCDFEVENENWSLATEIESMSRIDIGLMPLADTEITRGKCGFKLIQYMGLGIVSIASSISMNTEIIDDKINGFLVPNQDEWFSVMKKVIEQRDDFEGLGARARATIEKRYSFSSQKEPYLEFVNRT